MYRPHKKILGSELKYQVSRGDTNGEVIDH